MRTLPLFVALPLFVVGCGAEPLREPTPAEIQSIAWTGSFSDATCYAGTLSMQLARDGRDAYAGTLRYDTDAPGDLRTATYDVRASLEGGLLKIRQLGVASTNAPGETWCVGEYAFAVSDEDDGPALWGAYDAANDCGCGGLAQLASPAAE